MGFRGFFGGLGRKNSGQSGHVGQQPKSTDRLAAVRQAYLMMKESGWDPQACRGEAVRLVKSNRHDAEYEAAVSRLLQEAIKHGNEGVAKQVFKYLAMIDGPAGWSLAEARGWLDAETPLVFRLFQDLAESPHPPRREQVECFVEQRQLRDVYLNGGDGLHGLLPLVGRYFPELARPYVQRWFFCPEDDKRFTEAVRTASVMAGISVDAMSDAGKIQFYHREPEQLDSRERPVWVVATCTDFEFGCGGCGLYDYFESETCSHFARQTPDCLREIGAPQLAAILQKALGMIDTHWPKLFDSGEWNRELDERAGGLLREIHDAPYECEEFKDGLWGRCQAYAVQHAVSFDGTALEWLVKAD